MLKEHLEEIKTHLKAKEYDDAVRVVNLATATVQQGVREHKAYEQIAPMIEQRRKLAESEARRLKDLGQNIPLAQAIGLIGQIVKIFREYVTDPNDLRDASRKISELIN